MVTCALHIIPRFLGNMGNFAPNLLLWIEHIIRAISKYIAKIIRSTIFFIIPVFTTPHNKYPWSHISTIWPEYRFPYVVMAACAVQIPLGNLNSSRCLTKAQLDMIRENQINCHALISWHFTYTHPWHSWCRYSLLLLRNLWYCHYFLTYESLLLFSRLFKWTTKAEKFRLRWISSQIVIWRIWSTIDILCPWAWSNVRHSSRSS